MAESWLFLSQFSTDSHSITPQIIGTISPRHDPHRGTRSHGKRYPARQSIPSRHFMTAVVVHHCLWSLILTMVDEFTRKWNPRLLFVVVNLTFTSIYWMSFALLALGFIGCWLTHFRPIVLRVQSWLVNMCLFRCRVEMDLML